MRPQWRDSISLKEWFIRLLSLCLGLFLWYFVVGEDQVDMNITVPIEILNLPQHLVISNEFTKELEVSIRGPRSLIKELSNRHLTRPVDLSKARPGTIVIKNDENALPLPRGISVLRIQPTNITFLIDRLITRKFPIHPVTEGEPAQGWVLGAIKVIPDHLEVIGPKTLLESAMALNTYVINLDGLDHSTTLQVHLDLSSELRKLIGETVVTVKLTVKESYLRKTVHGIPVNIREAPVPLKIEPNVVTVVADIPENLVRTTPELAMLFRAFVNAKNVTIPGKTVVTVTGITIPGHAPIKVFEVHPMAVHLLHKLGEEDATKTGIQQEEKQPEKPPAQPRKQPPEEKGSSTEPTRTSAQVPQGATTP